MEVDSLLAGTRCQSFRPFCESASWHHEPEQLPNLDRKYQERLTIRAASGEMLDGINIAFRCSCHISANNVDMSKSRPHLSIAKLRTNKVAANSTYPWALQTARAKTMAHNSTIAFGSATTYVLGIYLLGKYLLGMYLPSWYLVLAGQDLI